MAGPGVLPGDAVLGRGAVGSDLGKPEAAAVMGMKDTYVAI